MLWGLLAHINIRFSTAVTYWKFYRTPFMRLLWKSMRNGFKKYTIRSEWLRLSLYGIAIDRPGAPAHRPMGPAARAKQGSEIKSIKEEMLLYDTEKTILPRVPFPST